MSILPVVKTALVSIGSRPRKKSHMWDGENGIKHQKKTPRSTSHRGRSVCVSVYGGLKQEGMKIDALSHGVLFRHSVLWQNSAKTGGVGGWMHRLFSWDNSSQVKWGVRVLHSAWLFLTAQSSEEPQHAASMENSILQPLLPILQQIIGWRSRDITSIVW